MLNTHEKNNVTVSHTVKTVHKVGNKFSVPLRHSILLFHSLSKSTNELSPLLLSMIVMFPPPTLPSTPFQSLCNSIQRNVGTTLCINFTLSDV